MHSDCSDFDSVPSALDFAKLSHNRQMQLGNTLPISGTLTDTRSRLRVFQKSVIKRELLLMAKEDLSTTDRQLVAFFALFCCRKAGIAGQVCCGGRRCSYRKI